MSVHLDYSVLSTLQEVMEDEYPTLLDVFFKDSGQRLSQMRLALEPHGPDLETLSLNAHSFKTARASNFKSAMEQISGRNLNVFFEQWYYNEGHPVLSGQWDQNGAGRINMQLSQTASTGNTVFVTPIDVTFRYAGGDTTMRIMLDAASRLYTFDLPGKQVYTIRIDGNDYILNEMISLARNPVMGIGQYPGFENVLIYPNPAHSQFTIANANGAGIRITDPAGKTVLSLEAADADVSVDISALPSGVYLLQFTRNGNTGYSKLIKH